MIALPTRARILVVTLRHLGDVLLTMPPMRSLKQAFPGWCLDALA
jgi:ADP-heptose:LPS heptosyltransferase